MGKVTWAIFGVLLSSTLVQASELAEVSSNFSSALPGYQFSFPRDHASHDNFQTEWWYYTGQFEVKTGDVYGYQLTFFRYAMDSGIGKINNPSRWAAPHLYFAHFALTDVNGKEFVYGEKISRAAFGKAGADSSHLSVWVDNWSVTMDGATHQLLAELRSSKTNTTIVRINFELVPEKPPAIHGEEGISKKGSQVGQASHYYSLTRLRTTGILALRGKTYNVKGTSWFDHEFGTNQLGSNQVGWDWFGLQLDDKSEIMLYRLRLDNGKIDSASSGSLITSNSQTFYISNNEFTLEPLSTWESPKSTGTYPISWRLRVPKYKLVLDIVPYLKSQELITKDTTRVTYWEGAVRVNGHKENKKISGQGYMELTGYVEPMAKRF